MQLRFTFFQFVNLNTKPLVFCQFCYYIKFNQLKTRIALLMRQSTNIRLYDRKLIFSTYQIPDIKQDNSRQSYLQSNSKANQQIQILLKKSALLSSNVTEVLQMEEGLRDKIQKSQQELKQINKILVMINLNYQDNQKQIKELCGKYFANKGSKIKSTNLMDKYFQLLNNFNESLKKSQILKYQIQSFRLGNLSNFDPRHTKPVFTKNSLAAKKILSEYLQKVQNCRFRLMESSIRNSSNDQKNRFLLDQQYYESCQYQLQQLNSIKKQQEVHFYMLNILDEFDKDYENFQQYVKSSQNNFKQHQAVYDSYNLMDHQVKIMNESINDWSSMVQTLIKKQAGSLNIQDQQKNNFMESQEVNQKNLKIFQLNERLFSRINTETNLQKYAERRNQFVVSLRKYEKNYKTWTQQKIIFQQIQSKNAKFNQVKKETEIKNNGVINKKNQEQLLDIRHQTSITPISNHPEVYDYKKSVVDSMTSYLKQKNIYIDQRSELNDIKDSQQISKLKKFKQFFMQIDTWKDKDKKTNLRNKKDDIKALMFQAILELSQPSSQKIKKEYQRYKISLQYCDAINQTDMNYSLQKLYEQSGNIWRPLPSQFQYYLSQNFTDCFCVKSLKTSKEWKNFQSNLNQYKKTNVSNQSNYNSIQQAAYRNFQNWNYNILDLYQFYLHKVSILSDKQFKIQQNLFWHRIATTQRQCQKSGTNFNSNIKSMDKKKFYQFKALSFISQRQCALSFHVENLPGMILYIIKHINSDFLDMRPKFKYLQIIKLTMMQEYLKHIQKTSSIKTELQIIQKLRGICILNILVDEYLSTYRQNDHAHIGYLIALHKFITTMQLKFTSTEKLQLQEAATKCLKYVIDQSTPLVFAIKKNKQINFQDVQSLYSLDNWMNEWQNQYQADIFSKEVKQKSLNFLCQTYVRLTKIDRLIKFSQLQWQQFENMLVRKRRSQSYKFRAQIQKIQKFKKKKKCQEAMINIMRMYKVQEKAPNLAIQVLQQLKDMCLGLKAQKM